MGSKRIAKENFSTTHYLQISDSREMNTIKDESVHLVVTSPPYPMIEMWDQCFGMLNSRIDHMLIAEEPLSAFELMHKELEKTWSEVVRVLLPGGIACINIGDATRTVNGHFQLFPNHSRITEVFFRLGMHCLPDIIWKKPTNAPNKYMGSGMLPPGAYVTLEHEYILIFRKGGKRLFNGSHKRELRKSSAYFWEERNQWFSDTWELKGISQKMNNQARKRSAAYPLEIPHRLINMFSVVGDTVLDPFNGTGTTTKAAIINARNSIGMEMDGGMVETLKETLRNISTEEWQSVRTQRITSHEKFLRANNQAGFNYNSKNLAFPVKTRQETGIKLPSLQALHFDNEMVRAEYEI